MLSELGSQKAPFAAAFFVLAAALIVVALVLAARGEVRHQSFKAFYCAGTAVRHHSDPYLVEPLRSCEQSVSQGTMAPAAVEPAPLPGYALAPFALLSLTNAKTASLLYAFMLACATIVAALVLGSLVRVSPTGVLLTFAPLALLNIAYGEMAPLVVAALCVAAFLLKYKRYTAAGIAVAVALLQPNIGVSAVLVVFLFAPKSRVAIAASAFALALLSLVTVGFASNVEYFASVLPLQAASELAATDQYSAAHLLFLLGTPPARALLFGRLIFAIVTVLGIVIAAIAAKRTGKPELLPLVPAALDLFLGVYVHDIQMIYALPALFVVLPELRGTVLRALGLIALALLVTVWTQHLGRAILSLDALAVFSAVLTVHWGSIRQRLGRAALATLFVLAALFLIGRMSAPVHADAQAPATTQKFFALPNENASAAWARQIADTPSMDRPEIATKLPTWFALLALAVCCASLVPAIREN